MSLEYQDFLRFAHMNDLLKFQCYFGGGTVCTISFDLKEYRRDPKNIRPRTTWAGNRSKGMFPQYQAWIHTVNQRIAEALQTDHAYVIQTWFEPPHWQFWVYHPNGDKKLVVEGNGQFDVSVLGR